ncbi:signal peptidase I S [Brevibacillus agri]|uniref:Signal peptidase I n=1 Tax=Brevibacillus agri TaxID=51101 RepID=A0A3M8BB12_9BACL|nr:MULTISPECIES: signal peptidase I [Brevibacillus]ELK40265.1 signal peptidase I [Brevibacillus agri BAB-2500]EJL47038.1 signal peptidase I [Brevibacillus sp. CF112]MBG9565656.1 signal peptidase I [Brevibacillus agri]MBY0053905.1 signal peptidase I [Brevibacillus agri]MCG5253076.1 signal peptidase I [Brevibacillus agri]
MNEEVSSGRTKKNELWEWTKALGIALILAFLIRTFLFAPFIVEGESMETTLHNSEKLVVNKAIYYLQEPKPGDIIVFHAEKTRDYIKRVIAVAGDTVEVKGDQLYINGNMVEEPYLAQHKEQAKQQGEPYFTNDFPPVTVPAGHIFVMGDNRPNSHDSRAIGPVAVSTVVGRAEFTFWPIASIRMTR